MAGTTVDMISASCPVLNTMATSKELLVLGVDVQRVFWPLEPILEAPQSSPSSEKNTSVSFGDPSLPHLVHLVGMELTCSSALSMSGVAGQSEANGCVCDPIWVSEIEAWELCWNLGSRQSPFLVGIAERK